MNVPIDQQVKVSGSVHSQFLCNYFSPHNFIRQKHRLAQSDNLFSIFHDNIKSLSKNLENLQNHPLNELDTHFSIIGVSETRIVKDKPLLVNPNLPGYIFKHVPTPLSAGGVGLNINELIPYRILEKESTLSFQTLWCELKMRKGKKISFVEWSIRSTIVQIIS